MSETTKPKVFKEKMIFPSRPVHEQVYEYHQSIKTLNEMYWKAYEWDKPRHTPELHLVATRRISDSITENLVEQRENARITRTHLDKQWRILYKNQIELRSLFKKMNDFIKTNQGKRERAAVIIADESQACVDRERQNADLAEAMRALENVKRKMDAQISAHRLYERYLEEAAGASAGEFKSVAELIQRYESLSETKRDLGNRQDRTMDELEAARARVIKMSEENNLEILGLNNTLANLSARYNSAVNKSMHWESLVWAIRHYSFSKYSELNEVKHSSWNIYLLMCQRKGETPKVKPKDFEQQLIFIKKMLQDLKNVNQQIKGVKKTKPSSDKAEVSIKLPKKTK